MISSALVSTSVALALLFGPPGDRPHVQTPSVSPIQPQPGEPAIAPAQIEGEAAIAEPAPVEPGPADSPLPETDPGLPSWQEGEPTQVPPPDVDPSDVMVEAGPVDEWGRPLPPPEKPIPPGGVGFYVGAGVLFGAMVTKQLVMGLTCEDVYCGYRGVADRLLGLGTMGMAAGGGWFDGRRAAYLRHDAGKPPKSLTGRRAAGWTMFALGLGGLIADTALYNVCYSSADGPYTKLRGFSYTCSPVTSVVLVDLSTLVGSVGLGLGMSGESQRRHQKKYGVSGVSLAPWGGRGQAGLSLSGRF
jgi:hypothetical protein